MQRVPYSCVVNTDTYCHIAHNSIIPTSHAHNATMHKYYVYYMFLSPTLIGDNRLANQVFFWAYWIGLLYYTTALQKMVVISSVSIHSYLLIHFGTHVMHYVILCSAKYSWSSVSTDKPCLSSTEVIYTQPTYVIIKT